ncbi:MAG: GNAT family N-acetyltransferase [Chloroflexi bacterium]|nr:GNAT family N-acetyltransferase [Chloroflexota bacterium]
MTAVRCRIASNDQDFRQCLAIRREVFIEEQGVPEREELDDLDAVALHVLVEIEQLAVATARLISEPDATARIGRMAVRESYRHHGIGTELLSFLTDIAHQQGVHTLRLTGQLHAIPFYERAGFEAEGDVFFEAGIPHRWMTHILDPGSEVTATQRPAAESI